MPAMQRHSAQNTWHCDRWRDRLHQSAFAIRDVAHARRQPRAIRIPSHPAFREGHMSTCEFSLGQQLLPVKSTSHRHDGVQLVNLSLWSPMCTEGGLPVPVSSTFFGPHAAPGTETFMH